jgi:hypothetical protein
MGGELGSLVASMLEAEPWVGALMGIDLDPPRRRLRRAEFHRIEPTDRDRIVDVVTAFDPHVLVHLAVWEPDARAGTGLARSFTDSAAAAFIGAAAECRSLISKVRTLLGARCMPLRQSPADSAHLHCGSAERCIPRGPAVLLLAVPVRSIQL